jgi:hypothetical protein
MKPRRPTRLLRKIALDEQIHLINAWNQPFCATAVVFIVGSKSLAERSLFNMNAIQHSQRWWNQDNGKTGPCARVEGEGQENQF